MEQFESSEELQSFSKLSQTIGVQLEELKEGFSFPFSKDEYTFETLEDFAEAASKGKRVFVVKDHASALELARLPDGTNRAIFYKQQRRASSVQCGQSVEPFNDLLRIVSEYAQSTFEEVSKYQSGTLEMKKEGIITKAYMQRRTSGLASFRKSVTGASEALSASTDALVSAGFIQEVPKSVAKGIFETDAKIYKILKTA
ncbi:hypothetical protein UFOVP40_13 [uncultured Caudovirales phage]|uniref:Uncharacterized protein n=1 Tax=uncultured Caudovirales phage TaxID=2100421 RepID=A0A6J5KPR8_9CAUD|nr:hypothetical protein UFOVP40_13 [uncultured Caudovirales phage]